jgi:hypothetical protein
VVAVGPGTEEWAAGKKIKRKEGWLVGWVKEREGGSDRDKGEELECGFQTLENLNPYLQTKALKQTKQMQRHACIQTLGEF